MKFLDFYYSVKPIIPRWFQLFLRRGLVCRQRKWCRDIWPIDERCAVYPEGWTGWPENKKFALILTHDVDTAKGHSRCRPLMDLEKRLGFRSSFNFVPERYHVSPSLRHYLTESGFEIGVHGLYHDGKYFKSREIFQKRAFLINHYLQEWDAVGFRSPSMLCNLEWIHSLKIEYDASTFDTDPFEPQPEGIRSIFPLWIPNPFGASGFVELPYSVAQDFTLFILLREKTIDVWKRKIDWLAARGGMVLLNTHPDYICFDSSPAGEEYPAAYYEALLSYIESEYHDRYWHVLPKEMARFWSGRISVDKKGTGIGL